ncbi:MULTISPECIES: hypothetical protein [Falsihalocynthiibacter]|uniref:hypothetical protein n=1 Tax=Falsihalocynthiibacter TaxID=2854182 RepID=UPI0030039027
MTDDLCDQRGQSPTKTYLAQFTELERLALHSLAEIFQDKPARDDLRRLVQEGTTLKEIILAYRTQRRMMSSLKAVASLIAVVGAAYAALKTLGVFPK